MYVGGWSSKSFARVFQPCPFGLCFWVARRCAFCSSHVVRALCGVAICRAVPLNMSGTMSGAFISFKSRACNCVQQTSTNTGMHRDRRLRIPYARSHTTGTVPVARGHRARAQHAAPAALPAAAAPRVLPPSAPLAALLGARVSLTPDGGRVAALVFMSMPTTAVEAKRSNTQRENHGKQRVVCHQARTACNPAITNEKCTTLRQMTGT